MKKNIFAGAVLTAAITAFGAFAAFAGEAVTVDTQGIKFEVPAEISDLVTVQTEGLENGTLVSVYEKASVEAAKAQGENQDGAGWIFSITAVPENEVDKLRGGAMDGMEVFAKDDDICYLYTHPTDVRFVRENYDDVEKDQQEWTKINEWAGQEVRQEILANNPELDNEFFTNTVLDMYLAKAAYVPGTKYELRSLDFGPDALDPSTLAEDDFIKELADDFTYEVLPDAEAPDGEYYVLAFNEDGEEIRFDFFKSQDGQNLVREVKTIDGEEITTLYQANRKDADDAGETTTSIVEAWCKSIAAGAEVDED